MMMEEVKDGTTPPSDILAKPDHVDESDYNALQEMCWAADPQERKSFAQLCTWIRGVQGQLGNATHPTTSDSRPSGVAAPYQTKLNAASKTYQPATSTDAAPYQTKISGGQTCQPANSAVRANNARVSMSDTVTLHDYDLASATVENRAFNSDGYLTFDVVDGVSLVEQGDNDADYNYHDTITSVIRVPAPLPPQCGVASVIDTPGYDMPDGMFASTGNGSDGNGSYRQLSIIDNELEI